MSEYKKRERGDMRKNLSGNLIRVECGKSMDMVTKVRNDKKQIINYICSDCAKLPKESKCLRCNKLIHPGCKISKLCVYCYVHNKSETNDY